ncbi:ATP-binding protein [Lacinutrix sp. 5H-3-7-4]|uniref:ATP-binding response regulator n=1 Tax=Lacinutrix sp. (strain 5H-3-7-4) TaxID=983544 RepID=UPI00020A35E3|nr:ATP-binding protein [Lacinutrix sp. 5H-3-7-4]AEH01293.1 ATP-binding region ATPase domain protein [Lacinutrix sp. 5H-3-7-4]
MSLCNKILSAFLLLLSVSVHSQNFSEQEIESLQVVVDNSLNKAQTSINTHQYFKAQQDLNKALENATTIDNKKSLGLIYSKMGKVNYALEAPNDAVKNLIKASELQRFSKDYINLAETYKTLGDVYSFTKDFDKALDYYKSAETYFNQESLHNYETEAILKKGNVLLALGNKNKAIKAFQKANQLANQYQVKNIASAALFSLAKAQQDDNLKDAIKKATQAFVIAKENGYANILNDGYLTLSSLYEKDNNLELANLYLKAHLKLSDSLLQVKRSQAALDKAQLLTINKTEFQNQKEADLQKESEFSTFDQLTTILSIALITILSLLTLSLYKNNNIRLKSNNILHKKNSELIVAMEKAELASRTKANFLSTVTHELRTPLYAVTGLTNMLLDEDPKPEQVQHLKSLKFSGDYLLTFINDILQINKIEANKVDIEAEVFNLKKKMSNVISALNNSALDNNIKIHLEYDESLPLNYNSDQLKISQILINLIGNSIKFTKDGDIWVRAKKISEKNGLYNVLFEIEDNGIGISKEKQEHMFESFSQGSIQINRKYGGTGLGLSIVKGLIDILKGKIYLKSELGKGSTFYFELPMQYTEQVVKEKEVNYFKDVEEVKLDNVKILVVEDNKINQMITKKILNKMKLNCDVVDNGEVAVDKVQNGNYDVVLMDIHMPGISGIEATKLIRAFDKDLTIFALTAVTIEDKMQEFDEAGFTDIISKPFKQEDFEKKLYEALIVKQN